MSLVTLVSGGPLKGRKVERRTKRISENTPAALKAHGFADVSYIMPPDVHRDAARSEDPASRRTFERELVPAIFAAVVIA